MIREFTKSALSFSWALSLLGLKQTMSLGKIGGEAGADLFAPVTQIAVGQLDESMKGIYRTGDQLSTRIVDFAFSPWSSMNSLKSGASVGPASWMNPGTWIRAAANMAPTSSGCCGQSSGPNSQQPVSRTEAGQAAATSADDEGSFASWG
jgi:hypothetical protein